jgi:hypothetical protein
MALTPAQLTTLKAAILAETDALFVEMRAANNEGGMAEFYNAATNPAFICWRDSVSQDEIMQNGFDWTRVDNLSVGKARVWEWLFNNQTRTFNPSKANVRAGIEAVWVGTAADLAVRAAVYTHCKRTATKGERVFASGTGSDASPGTFGFQGNITAQNISDALRA